MELSGETLIAAERSVVWAALNDAGILTACIPGCEAMENINPNERKVRMAVKVGPVRARFNGTILMDDIRENQGCRMSFQGNGGAAGVASGQSVVTLSDAPGGTLLHYTVNASVGGKLGQVGGRMIDGAAKSMADQFFNALQARLSPPAPSEEQPPETAASAQPESAAATPVPSHTGQHSPQHHTPSPGSLSDQQRVLWFVLGALASGFGFGIATILNR
jgi:carbon monoxide dehydrogenase subunit G